VNVARTFQSANLNVYKCRAGSYHRKTVLAVIQGGTIGSNETSTRRDISLSVLEDEMLALPSIYRRAAWLAENSGIPLDSRRELTLKAAQPFFQQIAKNPDVAQEAMIMFARQVESGGYDMDQVAALSGYARRLIAQAWSRHNTVETRHTHLELGDHTVAVDLSPALDYDHRDFALAVAVENNPCALTRWRAWWEHVVHVEPTPITEHQARTARRLATQFDPSEIARGVLTATANVAAPQMFPFLAGLPAADVRASLHVCAQSKRMATNVIMLSTVTDRKDPDLTPWLCAGGTGPDLRVPLAC
jgi:hypothetical protein